MHAEHADVPNTLTDPWVTVSRTAMALRAFVPAPAHSRLPTDGRIEVS
jgi:hypothetical protein